MSSNDFGDVAHLMPYLSHLHADHVAKRTSHEATFDRAFPNSQLVKREMAHRGLVEEIRYPGDRGITMLLTAKGRAAAETLAARHDLSPEAAGPPVEMYDDPRPIESIYYDDDDGSSWTAGQHGVTRIIAYREKGPGDFMPFLAVYRGADIVARVPAWKVTVHYEVKT